MARHGFPMPRGGGQDLPHARRLSSAKASRHGARAKGFAHARTRPSAKASRHGARAKGFAPRENALLGEGLPTRRTSERICPAREHAPRRRPPDTAHGRKGLPHAGTRPTAKASRHGARAKGFAPRGSCSPHVLTNGGPLPTDGQPEKHPFGGVAPDTAHGRKDLPRAGTRSSAKASRHGARAKGFAPRENALLGESLPTRRTSERICPAREHSPRRRPPDTAHKQKDLPRARMLSSAKASRHGARAKGFAPRENAPRGEGLPTRRTGERICPAGFAFAPRADERRAALGRYPDRKTPFGGVAPEMARSLPSSFTEKK